MVLYVYYDMEGFSLCNICHWCEMDSEEGAQTWSAAFGCMYTNNQKPPFPHTHNSSYHTFTRSRLYAHTCRIVHTYRITHTHEHPILDCSEERTEFSKHCSPGYTRLPLCLYAHVCTCGHRERPLYHQKQICTRIVQSHLYARTHLLTGHAASVCINGAVKGRKSGR